MVALRGQLVERGPHEGRCRGRGIRGDLIEPIVGADIERFLRDPGELLAELDADAEHEAGRAVVEAETVTLVARLDGLGEQRQRAIGLGVRGVLSDAELDAELQRIAGDRADVERRLAALAATDTSDTVDLAPDVLGRLRERLDAGLTIEEQQEIVRLLVARIVVHTEELPTDKKAARAVIEYRMHGVAPTRTGTGSSRQLSVSKVRDARPISYEPFPSGGAGSDRRSACARARSTRRRSRFPTCVPRASSAMTSSYSARSCSSPATVSLLCGADADASSASERISSARSSTSVIHPSMSTPAPTSRVPSQPG